MFLTNKNVNLIMYSSVGITNERQLIENRNQTLEGVRTET